MFWLSHHHAEELHRCYRVGPLHVCARCLGTYPVLAFVFVAQLVWRAPLSHPLDVPIGVALILPATLDWALGRFDPHRFSNPWRTLTGFFLGMGLGRSLFIHVQQPLPAVLLAQGFVVTLISLPVILVAYLRKTPR